MTKSQIANLKTLKDSGGAVMSSQVAMGQRLGEFHYSESNPPILRKNRPPVLFATARPN